MVLFSLQISMKKTFHFLPLSPARKAKARKTNIRNSIKKIAVLQEIVSRETQGYENIIIMRMKMNILQRD